MAVSDSGDAITVRPLKYHEYRPFMDLLNEGGYILNFSTSDFDRFTYSIIGIRLVEHFTSSKGKSLQAYVESADRADSAKLLSTHRRMGASTATLCGSDVTQAC